MTPAEYETIQTEFLAIRELDKVQRLATLAKLAAKSPDIADHVKALLECDSDGNSQSGFLEKSLVNRDEVDFEKTMINQAPTEDLPRRIGPYRILQKIGEGGHGVVYMANQTEPIRRQVALKWIKPGMDSQMVLARFEAERQALAMMSHPSIANVIDAGKTESEQPYFVMELVHGIPIDEFCETNDLPLNERLLLFAQVCDAVHHAHRKGIIHRDIKPANVLVTVDSGKPLPKVIDFGIAKALHMPLTERTLFTEYGQIVGTLEYMSPEQALMSQDGIDVRSDVYSLGVLLYVLITGETPLSKQQLLKDGLWKLRDALQDIQPPTPSLRITRGVKNRPWSEFRETAPGWSSSVKGDLDWITMKALAKNADQRYDSAAAFAADIANYINNEQVVARPPSVWYSSRKFLNRHRGAAIVASALLASMLIAVLGLLYGYRQSQSNLTDSRAMSQLLGDKADALNASLKESNIQRQRADDHARELAVQSERRILEAAWSHAMDGDRQTSAEQLAQIPVERREFCWRLIDSIAAQMELPRLRHRSTGGIRISAAHPKTSRLAVLNAKSEIEIRDIATRQLMTCIQLPDYSYSTMTFSPDGTSMLLGASPGTVLPINIENPQQILPVDAIDLRTGGIRSIVSSSDGQHWFVVTGANYVHMLDASRSLVDSFQLPKRVRGLTLSDNDAAVIVFALDGTVFEVPIQDKQFDRQSMITLNNPHGQVLFAQASPERIWGYTEQGVIIEVDGPRLSNPSKMEQRSKIPGSPVSLTYTDNNQLIIAMRNGSLVQLDPQTNEQIPLRESSSVVGQLLSFDSQHQTAIIETDGDIFLLPDTERSLIKSRYRNVHDVTDGFSWTNENLTVTAHQDGHLRTWTTDTSDLVTEQNVHNTEVFELAVDQTEKRIASVGADRRLVVSRLPNLETVFANQVAWGVRGAAFSPDGRRLASAAELSNPQNQREGTVDVRQTSTGSVIHRLVGHTNWVTELEFINDGQQLVTLSVDETVRTWSMVTGECIQTIDFSRFTNGTAMTVIDSPSQVVIGHRDGNVTSWNPISGELRYAKQVARDSIRELIDTKTILLAISEGSSHLLTLNRSNLDSIATFPARIGALQALRKGPGADSLLLTGSSGASHIWQVDLGNEK